MDGFERKWGKVPQRDPGLIGDDEKRGTESSQPFQPLTCPGGEFHLLRTDVIGDVLEHRTVLVQEDGRRQGHDVSFIGNTMTSGMTVCGGCVRTNLTARATFCGSWS